MNSTSKDTAFLVPKTEKSEGNVLPVCFVCWYSRSLVRVIIFQLQFNELTKTRYNKCNKVEYLTKRPWPTLECYGMLCMCYFVSVFRCLFKFQYAFCIKKTMFGVNKKMGL